MIKIETPVEIDTALAAAYRADDQAHSRMLGAASTMRYLYAENVLGMRRVPHGRKGAQFPPEASPAAAADWFRTLDQNGNIFSMFRGGYSGRVGETLARFDEAVGRCIDTAAQIGHLAKLYRGWSRFFVVTSSTGHIHSSQSCHTCRPTTAFGWLPDMSGLSEADALVKLFEKGGDRAASALCSVCFPNAPVEHVGGKITKSMAEEMAA
jgi:hypothetical protein